MKLKMLLTLFLKYGRVWPGNNSLNLPEDLELSHEVCNLQGLRPLRGAVIPEQHLGKKN